MSKLQDMLRINGGSFARAEQWALELIARGHSDVYLDLALLLHAQGKLVGARQAVAEYAKVFPGCARGEFAATWFKLHDGDLAGGLEHIEAGRKIGTLGEPHLDRLTQPQWDGRASLAGKTVLLYGEGGQGDQMMGLRGAVWLKERGARVVAACSASLVPLFAGARGVDAVVTCEAVGHVYHDYWVPSMSVFRLCGVSWETLWPGVYVRNAHGNALWDRVIPRGDGVLNVGLRWRGNPEFEHEQFRWFPVKLMLGLAEVKGCRFWSLQKDDRTAVLPEGVVDLERWLSTWEETASVVERMDVVITSCTGVAHLAAAMGRETWVVVPAMPYYPWARPGAYSDWYPSVRLFRQECFGEWAKPFAGVRAALEARVAIGSSDGASPAAASDGKYGYTKDGALGPVGPSGG